MTIRDPLPNLWPAIWTGARPLRAEDADLLRRAMRAVFCPVPCTPVRLDLGRHHEIDLESEPEKPRIKIRSGTCGRCGNLHSWPDNWGGGRRLYCDSCKRY